MTKQLFLPESMYEMDSKMNRKKLLSSYKSNLCITGKVLRLNSKDKVFEVNLGGDFIGIMPFEESTIYPIYKDNGKFTFGFISLVGKTIQAKIIKYDNNNIIISRKSNMLNALSILKQTSEINFAQITSFSQLSAFMDIGAGIIGKCSTYNFSNTIFTRAKDVGFKKGNILHAKILKFQEDLKAFDLSIVGTLEEFKDALNEDDIVACKVFGCVGDDIGYYVLINNKYTGIVDSPFYRLRYGDEISASISKIAQKGPRLKLVEIL